MSPSSNHRKEHDIEHAHGEAGVDNRHRVWPTFEEFKGPGKHGIPDMETGLFFMAPNNGGYHVEGRFGPLHGDDVSLLEVRIRFDSVDEDEDDGTWDASPVLPRFDSSFGTLLGMALGEWCEVGRFANRRLDDVLFHEYYPERHRTFTHLMQDAYSEYASGYESGHYDHLHPDVRPPRLSPHMLWAPMIIQAAVHSRDPERIARILDAEARFTLEQDDEYDEVEIGDDDRAELLAWPSEWRRMFG